MGGWHSYTESAMPIYEYRCENGHTFEVMQKMTDDPVSACSTCEAPVQRVFHPVAVHFKGKGFYNTDYGTKRRQRELERSGSSDSSSERPKSDTPSKADSGASASSGSSSSSDSTASSSSGDKKSCPRRRRASPTASGRCATASPSPHEPLDLGLPLGVGDVEAVAAVGEPLEPARLEHARRGVPVERQPDRVGEQPRAAHVRLDGLRHVPRDERQAQESMKREDPALHGGQDLLLAPRPRPVVLAAVAEVLPRAREGERLTAVDVGRAALEPEREATVLEAAVDARDDAPARVVDPAHGVDQRREVREVDEEDVVDVDPEVSLDGPDGQRWAADRVRGVDLVAPVAGDVDDRVARDRQLRAVPAAEAQEHDAVRAARTGDRRAGLARAGRPPVRAEHERRLRARQADAAARERGLGGVGDRVLLQRRADQEEHEREEQPAGERDDEPLDDAPDGDALAPLRGGPRWLAAQLVEQRAAVSRAAVEQARGGPIKLVLGGGGRVGGLRHEPCMVAGRWPTPV